MAKIDGAEVARHNTKKSCWLLLDSRVYDVTSFQSEHPGGTVILLKNAGTVIFSHSLCLWPNLLANETPGRNHRIQKIPPLDICEATPSRKRPRSHRPKHPRQTQQTKRNNKFSRKWGRCWKQDPSCLSLCLLSRFRESGEISIASQILHICFHISKLWTFTQRESRGLGSYYVPPQSIA